MPKIIRPTRHNRLRHSLRSPMRQARTRKNRRNRIGRRQLRAEFEDWLARKAREQWLTQHILAGQSVVDPRDLVVLTSTD